MLVSFDNSTAVFFVSLSGHFHSRMHLELKLAFGFIHLWKLFVSPTSLLVFASWEWLLAFVVYGLLATVLAIVVVRCV